MFLLVCIVSLWCSAGSLAFLRLVKKDNLGAHHGLFFNHVMFVWFGLLGVYGLSLPCCSKIHGVAAQPLMSSSENLLLLPLS